VVELENKKDNHLKMNVFFPIDQTYL